ncbi:hypothetical protein BSKO_01096 [Bryopsis sp. KO-2023]|nr:hypothetical protein BSKO_01096 [Bryopsis sp. KO-2023]
MEDLSLDDLTAQLQAVQKKTSTTRLSERNIVELVNKLKELGFLGDDLLHTINGQEYITTDKLRQEIQDALHNAGGRLPMADLPSLLNVDLVHCEVQVDSIVADSGGAVTVIENDIVTIQYFDSIAVEINDILQDSGMLKVGDLASQFSLSSEMILSVLSPRLGKLVLGHLQAGMVYTSMYIDRMKAQLRGALRAVMAPTSLTNVVKAIGLEGGGISDMVNRVVEDLIKEKSIKGQLRSGGQWIPAIYVRAQQEAVRSFYNQNGWIALETIRRLGTASEDAFIKEHFPESTKLHAVLISSGLIAQVDAEIKEAATSKTWCDIVPLLPADFTSKDISSVMKHCPAITASEASERMTVLAETFAISKAFLQDCGERARQEGKANAVGALRSRQESAKQGDSKLEKQPQEKKAPVQQDQQGDADDDWGDLGKVKGKKKAKGGKAKGKGKSGGSNQAPGSKGQPSGIGDEPPNAFYPTCEKVSAKLMEWFSDLEDFGVDAPIVVALAESILPEATKEYQETIKAATRTVSQSHRQIKDSVMKAMEDGAQKLWLYMRGTELLESDPATHAAINRGLVRSTGVDAVDWLLRLMQLQEPNADIAEPLVPIPAVERNHIPKTLPPDMTEEAEQALESIKGDDPKVVFQSIEKGAECLGIRFKKMDKKFEKQKLAEFRAVLTEQISMETVPANALAQGLPLLFTKIHGRALSIPGRAMPGVIKFLKMDMEPQEHEVLESMHKLVVLSLKAQSDREQGEEGVDPQELEETLVKLRKICTSKTSG